jgi:hypothetical protein
MEKKELNKQEQKERIKAYAEALKEQGEKKNEKE